MSRNKAKRDERARKTGRLGVARAERYALLPDDVLTSPAVSTLSPPAFKVLVVLAAQYCGRNNGRLTLPFSVAREYGLCSKDTLVKALRELVERGLIVETHKGGLPPYGCSRYLLTWRDRDPDEAKGQVTTTPATHDYGKWTPSETRRSFRGKTDRPVRPTDQTGPSHGPQSPPTGPSHGPQTDDHWSVPRTLSRSGGGGPGPGHKPKGPGAPPPERISKLISRLPHLSDNEVAKILSADPGAVRSVRHSMERVA